MCRDDGRDTMCIPCKDRNCVQRRKQWTKGTQNLEYQTERLQKKLEQNIPIIWTKHLDDREIMRNISSLQSAEALKNGYCIWYNQTSEPQYGSVEKWIWLGYAKTGPKTYKPLHLVLSYSKDSDRIIVLTVYDPSVLYWMWNKTFEKRICWHKEHPIIEA
ncbi:hypothetical protein SAMN05443507_1295 [Alicyclobacillus tolerans]|uniref:Uncharacterized protein n=1 Tax=Alicyclobacillus tolerans TaxID=90970 RepID=A0A1M6WQ16_9BACL|nr:hypothetical protein SAMN05443507_1295 [Alicyclobacillus montanus]